MRVWMPDPMTDVALNIRTNFSLENLFFFLIISVSLSTSVNVIIKMFIIETYGIGFEKTKWTGQLQL